MRASQALASAAVIFSCLGIQAAPSLPLTERENQCELTTNTITGIYNRPDYGLQCGTCPEGRIATTIQKFLDKPTTTGSDMDYALFRCKQGVWSLVHDQSTCILQDIYPDGISDAYLSSHKYLRIPTYAGHGDQACCGYYDHVAKTRATCDKPSDYTQ